MRLIASRARDITNDEISGVMEKLKDFYMRAYNWNPGIDMAEITKNTDGRGYLLRTKIRSAVECLDQLYQYNQFGDIKISELGDVSYGEDTPELRFSEP